VESGCFDRAKTMSFIPRRHSHFVYGVIQSGVTSMIAAAVASLPFLSEGTFMVQWSRASVVAWLMMLPVVIFAAPAIHRCTRALTKDD
jgi:hypothetical protein